MAKSLLRIIEAGLLACAVLAIMTSRVVGQAPAPAQAAVAKSDSAEARYMARLDALIAPVRDIVPTPGDIERLARAAKPGDAARSQAELAAYDDPAARSLAEWLILKSGYGEAEAFASFLAAHTVWPEAAAIRRRGEEALFVKGGSARAIKAFFGNRQPEAGVGHAALASAFLFEGNEAQARTHARAAWREHELPALLEKGFLERFGKYLEPADHRHRFDRILVDEIRFSGERRQRAEVARRVLPLLPAAERKTSETRLALFMRPKQPERLLASLPAETAEARDWGLAFQRVQTLRRIGKQADATAMLLSAPTDPKIIVSPDDWWFERRAAAYEALKSGKPKVAYDLVKAAGPLSVNPLKDQTFMAGWIAFRLLGQAKTGLAHLEASRAAADGPLSRSRADYWRGRALETLGRTEEARAAYKAATGDIDTFHAQLAQERLGGAQARRMTLPLPALPTEAEAKRFTSMPAVRAAVIATKAGLDRNVRLAFFGHLRYALDSEADLAMLAHLAGALGDTQISLRVGKTAIGRNKNLFVYAYPLHAFPSYTPLRTPPELPMLLGIARQETEFNNTIISTAGARGLLQVMPITATHVCRQHRIKCEIPRLLTDNAYNAQIASAYVGDRMAEFGGSYVLALAGYNAGPGRARQWIRENGDPRDPNVDAIDWIERIPIEETREYVKKVLSNIQIYRARLGEPEPLRLTADLALARTGKPKAAEPTPAAQPQPATTGN